MELQGYADTMGFLAYTFADKAPQRLRARYKQITQQAKDALTKEVSMERGITGKIPDPQNRIDYLAGVEKALAELLGSKFFKE